MSRGWLLLAGAAYLAGSLPFSYLAVRLLRAEDIRRLGSGNAGATNVLRVAGLGPALAVLLLDIAKGALPVWAARELGAPPWMPAVCAAAAVAGHVYPLFLGFRGGKGVATAVGAAGTLAPLATAAAVAVLVLLVAWTRYVSLGSVVAVGLLPVLLAAEAAVRGSGPETVWNLVAAAVVALLVVIRHASNIQRLWSGTERRLGRRMESVS